MSITALTEAAEIEQALAATEVLDQAPVPWNGEAHCVVFARFGGAGEDLPYEYQNTVYEIEDGGPVDVVFH